MSHLPSPGGSEALDKQGSIPEPQRPSPELDMGPLDQEAWEGKRRLCPSVLCRLLSRTREACSLPGAVDLGAWGRQTQNQAPRMP